MIFEHKGLACSYSKKPHNMSLCHGDTSQSLENRRKFLNSLDISYRDLVCAKQVHAGSMYSVSSVDKGRGALSHDTAIPGIDALITSQKGIPLGIFTADCLSVFMYEPKVQAAAIVHAGWRSTKELICKKTIKKMIDEFGIDPSRLLIGFGPAIRSCCYEVGEEFKKHFKHGVINKGDKYFLDLAEINKKQLLDSGVRQDNITDCDICTACTDSAYFSFRKDGPDCGRIVSVIMIK
ncbi:MAG: peptidoglycan editing factor PgeF [Candidatus Omnitrophica bacterium]|nr:peptidoglycan editing factor PgeF [Candidatus Omnitrophota bacterium]